MVDTLEVVPLEEDPSKALTVRFSVEKTLATTPNKAELQILNLNPDHQAELASAPEVPVSIEAGYAGGSSTIFVGRLRRAITVQEGPDVVTSLSSGDGAVEAKQARVSLSLKKDGSSDIVLRELARALGVSEGNLSQAVSTLKSSPLARVFGEGTVIYGPAARQMTHVCRSAGLTWSVQDGKLQFLQLRQALPGEAILLRSDTGLLDSPTLDPKGVLKARMLLAPDVAPGRLLVLESKRLQGQFRIEKTKHVGDTSGTDWHIEIEAKRY